jgi:tRNA(fMet)-specific endonuclease VapC
VNYLLDTNACIALMSSTPNSAQARFARAFHKGDKLYTSAVVAFELWYGVFKSARIPENTRRYETLFSGPIGLMPFEEADARVAGELRARLEAAAKPIGAYDLLLAGQALRHDMILVTANVSEFSRVKGLSWEDWSNG